MDPCDPTTTDCAVTDGATLRFSDALDSPVPDPPVSFDTPREDTMPEAEAPTPDAGPQDAAPAPDTTDAAPTPDAGTLVPDAPTASDLAGLAAATGGDSTLTIVLALIAVVGGAAGWKFFSQVAEQRHEQNMKRLDIEAQSIGIGKAQPQACATKHAELSARMDALSERLTNLSAQADALTKRTATLDADFDASDLERQVKRLTKTVKSMQEGTHT